MNALLTPWRQLVQRRLWPVALLLLAALAAVPFLLAKDAEPAPAVPSASVQDKDSIETKPIVAMASLADRAKPRKVLGKRKNPFAPDPDAIVKAPKASDSAGGASKSGGSDGKTADSDTTTSAGGSSPVGSSPSPISIPGVTEPGPAPDAKPKPAPYSLTVRFGPSSNLDLDRMNVKQGDALPSVEEPLLVYLHPKKGDSKTAVFLLDAGVLAQGDGECRPDPNTCEKIELREGETEFFDAVGENGGVGEQFQLDLIDVHVPKGDSAARTSRAVKAGRRALRGYRWGDAAGALERRSDDRTLRATVASQTVSLP